MTFKSRLRRHRVVLRPKVRSQRSRQLAAFAALACLGALALLTLLQLKREGASWEALKAKLMAPARRAEVRGAPAALGAGILAFVEPRIARPASPEEVMAAFPCLKKADLSRSYWRRALVYEVSLRKAVGAVSSRGGSRRYLDEEGIVFEAPEGLYAVSGPLLELDGAAAAGLKSLAVFLPAAAKPDALPSPLAAMRFVSAMDGWEARLSDGTVLLWGDLIFTQQKFMRLREILADARVQFGGASSADLRYFEDGRVLLKPPLRAGR